MRVLTCRTCHKQIHASFTNKELDKDYTSVDSLQRSPRMEAFLKWVRKQRPDRVFSVDTNATRPGPKRRRLPAGRQITGEAQRIQRPEEA